jgi:hypothetical protein
MRNNKNNNNNSNNNNNNRDEEYLGKLDFSSCLPHHFLKKIVKSVNFEKSREKIIAEKKEGECLTERLQKIPKMTSASLINAGQTHVLGEPVFDYVHKKVIIKREEIVCKLNNDKAATRKVRKDVDDVFAQNRGKPLPKWMLQDLKLIIKPEKTKDDGAMPSKRGI